ncbi:MAG: ATP-dependent DNA helicase RecG [Erysipelothrix sp.]|nr:ATP-dependent DNA helicase RecG [Erysipelothrix sp.]
MKLLKTEEKIVAMLALDKLEDLLKVYPYRYDHNEVIAFEDWKLSDKVFFNGVLLNKPRVAYFNRRSSANFDIEYEGNIIHCRIYNRPWVNKLEVGANINIQGKYNGQNNVAVSNYSLTSLEDNLGLFPVYSLSAGISIQAYRKFVKKVYDQYHHEIIDDLPNNLKAKYKLLDLKTALKYIHFPNSLEEITLGRRTLKYREFLRFNLEAQLRIQDFKSHNKVPKEFDQAKLEALINNLDFALTTDQRSALDQLLGDLNSTKIMNRLLQGDVGSGKTIVAALLIYANYLSGSQSAFMAPTELLAIQQEEYLKGVFKGLDVNVASLYSAKDQKAKQAILNALASGEIDVIVGTHSLFQDDTVFLDLGLVVIDEQQRFGVNQRSQLFAKGIKVDRLLMSATPIPRTMASVLFADMDISTIREKPAYRKEIKTKLIKENSMKPILNEIINHLKNGEQIYVVTPAIEDDEEVNVASVEQIYKSLNIVFNQIEKLDVKVASLHGKQDSDLKNQIMQDFASGHYDVLVATTVIEVGIDNPNANIIVIYDANYFGLSQLHQLRGRVGRSNKQAYAYLLSKTKDPDALAKLEFIESHTDGFEISEYDLQVRGPGDVIGIRQSGIPNFILGDLEKDKAMMEIAKTDAIEIIRVLDNPDYHDIMESVRIKNNIEGVE